MHDSSVWKTRLIGLAMVLVLALLFAVAIAAYARVFTARIPVVLESDRTGLIMDPGSAVTLRGVQVGEVTAIEERDGKAVLHLGIDPDEIGAIPANVLAEIVPTTVFGTKLVSLAEPATPSSQPLAEGAVLRNDHVTVEVNNVFDTLNTLLTRVDVAQLNSTLGEVAKAVDGRGDDIARSASVSARYLEDLNPLLPQLQRDVVSLADVAQLYADISPDLLRLLGNASTTSDTLVSQAEVLDAFLLDATQLSDTARTVLAENTELLVTALDLLRPTAGLLERYSPELTCFITGLDESRKMIEPVIGGVSSGVRLETSVTLGKSPYRNPKDLPELASVNGPACYGQPLLGADDLPVPTVDTGTGATPYSNPSNTPAIGEPAIAPLLFGPLESSSTVGGGAR